MCQFSVSNGAEHSTTASTTAPRLCVDAAGPSQHLGAFSGLNQY